VGTRGVDGRARDRLRRRGVVFNRHALSMTRSDAWRYETSPSSAAIGIQERGREGRETRRSRRGFGRDGEGRAGRGVGRPSFRSTFDSDDSSSREACETASHTTPFAM
jgi:hypothetical protein